MRFDDLARNDDPTRINEQMVVTLDAQLFYSVLSALPYLVNYPYECTEQTLNRFVSTGILSSLYQQYPAIERMAKEFSSTPDAVRTMGCGGSQSQDGAGRNALASDGQRRRCTKAADLINVLDSRIAKAQREAALAKLRQIADFQRRISLVLRRAAFALHDALSSLRIFQGAGIRRRGPARDGASRPGIICTGITSMTSSGR